MITMNYDESADIFNLCKAREQTKILFKRNPLVIRSVLNCYFHFISLAIQCEGRANLWL